MNQFLKLLLCCFILLPAAGRVLAVDRATEIKTEMWNTSDKDFKITATPDKWATRSAIIMAELHRFEYRKSVMAHSVHYNNYSHYRIKLNDKNALNDYAELSYSANSSSTKVYAGFKVVKPNGSELIVDLAKAVKMERDGAEPYYKIAIPNLEAGDILDYYICEENVTAVRVIEFFTPVIYNLVQEYPVMKQKIQFKVMRKCYINLRSVNGAPQLKLVTDPKEDEEYYSLEDGDRDGIAHVKWLYPNRELPTIKFRAAYATAAAKKYFDVFLDQPGVVKNKVSDKDVVELTDSQMKGVEFWVEVNKYIKRHLKKEKDPIKISKAVYYFLRSESLKRNEELTLRGRGLSTASASQFTRKFTTFLKAKKIPHDIVVGVERNISAIDDIIMEQELDYLIRVKNGSGYLYLSPYDIFTLPGAVYPRLQNTEAYAIDGMTLSSRSMAKKITIPGTTMEDNVVETNLTVRGDDFTTTTLQVSLQAKGVNSWLLQHELLDVYDAIAEDHTRYEPSSGINLDDVHTKSEQRELKALKSSYDADRAKNQIESLKKSLQDEYEFKVKDASDFKVIETGRFEDKPKFNVSYNFTSEELFKKTGPNYIFDIGKLIESQVAIEGDELKRDYAVYFDFPRSYKHTITYEIPKGYEVQGIEKLNVKVERSGGGFTSSARQEGNKLIVETNKHYNQYNLAKELWPATVEFLNAANTFTAQKVLLKKVN